jgi:hypothetical protein
MNANPAGSDTRSAIFSGTIHEGSTITDDGASRLDVWSPGQGRYYRNPIEIIEVSAAILLPLRSNARGRSSRRLAMVIW